MAFSMAHGVGTLTSDEKHELMRRKIINYQPTNGGSPVIGHLYTGVKGLGFGVIGGIAALLNPIDGAKKEGLSVSGLLMLIRPIRFSFCLGTF